MAVRLVLENEIEKPASALSNEQLMSELDEIGRPWGKGPSLFEQVKAQVLAWAERGCLAVRGEFDPDFLTWYREQFDIKELKRFLGKTRRLWKHAVKWHRIRAYQQVSLLQLSESLVVRPHHLEHTGRFLECPGGPLDSKFLLKAPPSSDGFHCYVSPHNAGAVEFVHDELRTIFDGRTPLQIAYSPGHLHEWRDKVAVVEQWKQKMGLQKAGMQDGENRRELAAYRG